VSRLSEITADKLSVTTELAKNWVWIKPATDTSQFKELLADALSATWTKTVSGSRLVRTDLQSQSVKLNHLNTRRTRIEFSLSQKYPGLPIHDIQKAKEADVRKWLRKSVQRNSVSDQSIGATLALIGIDQLAHFQNGNVKVFSNQKVQNHTLFPASWLSELDQFPLKSSLVREPKTPTQVNATTIVAVVSLQRSRFQVTVTLADPQGEVLFETQSGFRIDEAHAREPLVILKKPEYGVQISPHVETLWAQISRSVDPHPTSYSDFAMESVRVVSPQLVSHCLEPMQVVADFFQCVDQNALPNLIFLDDQLYGLIRRLQRENRLTLGTFLNEAIDKGLIDSADPDKNAWRPIDIGQTEEDRLSRVVLREFWKGVNSDKVVSPFHLVDLAMGLKPGMMTSPTLLDIYAILAQSGVTLPKELPNWSLCRLIHDLGEKHDRDVSWLSLDITPMNSLRRWCFSGWIVVDDKRASEIDNIDLCGNTWVEQSDFRNSFLKLKTSDTALYDLSIADVPRGIPAEYFAKCVAFFDDGRSLKFRVRNAPSTSVLLKSDRGVSILGTVLGSDRLVTEAWHQMDQLPQDVQDVITQEKKKPKPKQLPPPPNLN